MSVKLTAMLDTNTLDDIYRMNLADKLKLAVNTGKIRFFMTHVQLDEIAKIKDDTKRVYILDAIRHIPVEKIATAGGVWGTDEPSKKGFVGSRFDEARFVSDEENELLRELTRRNSNSPMKNTADLMIAFTAVKEKMNCVVTANDRDFYLAVKKMSTKLRTNTAVIDIETLLSLVSKLP